MTLVFISLFNTILGALGAREWEEKEMEAERVGGGGGKRERLGENERKEFHLHACFNEAQQRDLLGGGERVGWKHSGLKFSSAAWFIYYQ